MTESAGYESLRIRARVSRLAVITTVALALAGCSITSEDSHDHDITKHMRCVAAHDQDVGHHQDVVRTLCDSWSPMPEATP